MFVIVHHFCEEKESLHIIKKEKQITSATDRNSDVPGEARAKNCNIKKTKS